VPQEEIKMTETTENVNEIQVQELMDGLVKSLPRVRKMLGLNQTEFGEKIGLCRQSVSGIERGLAPMTRSTFLAIMFLCTVNDVDIYFNDDKYFDILREVLYVE